MARLLGGKASFQSPAGSRVDAPCVLAGSEDAKSTHPDAALVAKGEYLARAGDSIACHTVRGGKQFAGGLPMATPFGTMFTPNITPDDQYGHRQVNSRTTSIAPMHTGRSKDGSLLYPELPVFTSYTKVTRADSDAIYAFLRSDPAGQRQPSRPHELKFPFNQRSLIPGWRALFFSEGDKRPDPNAMSNGIGVRIWSRARALRDVSHGDQRAGRQVDQRHLAVGRFRCRTGTHRRSPQTGKRDSGTGTPKTSSIC